MSIGWTCGSSSPRRRWRTSSGGGAAARARCRAVSGSPGRVSGPERGRLAHLPGPRGWPVLARDRRALGFGSLAADYAFDYAVGPRPAGPWFDPPVITWTCPACEQTIRDRGPVIMPAAVRRDTRTVAAAWLPRWLRGKRVAEPANPPRDRECRTVLSVLASKPMTFASFLGETVISYSPLCNSTYAQRPAELP
jgi:hypothetical protein